MTNFSSRVFRIVAGALVLLVLAVLGIRFAFNQYLKSDACRRKLAGAIAGILKADGELMPLHLVGAALYSDGFSARGNRASFFSDLRADQLRAELNWRGLFHRQWQVDELNVQKVEIRFTEHKPEARNAAATESYRFSQAGGWKLDLRKANIQNSTWRWGENDQAGSITGTTLSLLPGQDSWLIDAGGGRLVQTGWPELSIESAKLRYTSSSLFLTESIMRNGAGRLLVSGEIDFNAAADLRAQVENISITPLLPLDWRARLTGNLSGTAKLHAPLSATGEMQAEGNMSLSNGQVEALPVLNQIATFTRTERFRRLGLTTASLDFTRDAKIFTGKNVILESEGLLRVEGAFSVVNGQIDGLFQVGVSAASLQWLPGSQARVFTIAHDGYFWTPLRLTGPAAHPTEDLTPRLVTAAAGELLQNSEDALRETAKTLLDLIPH